MNVKNSAGMVRRGFEIGILKSLAKQSILTILLLILTIGSISVSAQNEIELRTDGIVVPRTVAGSVFNPVEGQLIYDIDSDAFVYYDGSDWQFVGSGNGDGSGAFERVGNVVRQVEGVDTDDLIFGRTELPPAGGRISDTLMFFDQSTGALRAGVLRNSIAWNKDELGSGSFATGFGTWASGANSVAFGENTRAFGNGSIAGGFSTEASGRHSIALGFRSIAAGLYSAAFGEDTYAVMRGSTAFGKDSRAVQARATAFGLNTEAAGESSTAFGDSTLASGIRSLAIGHTTIASGDNAVAMGFTSNASGYLSMAAGYATQASGNGAVALGSQNQAIGHYSFTSGIGNEVHANFSAAFGEGNHVNTYSSFVAGRFNDTIVANTPYGLDKPLFIIGNGTMNSDRSNALVIRQLGNVGINVDSAVAKLEVATNSERKSPTLELHQTDEGGADSFVRQAFSNHSSDEKWFIVASPSNTPSSGRLNFYHTDGAGGEDVLKLEGDGDAIIERDLKLNNGNLTVNGTGESLFEGDLKVVGTFTNPSDIRYKKDIVPLKSALVSITNMGGYRYNWKDENKPESQIGLIAQEVQAVYPELVKEDEEGMLSVSYTKMVPVLLEAIKEQQQLIESLERRLEKLEHDNNHEVKTYIKSK